MSEQRETAVDSPTATKLHITVITLFPELIRDFCTHSLLGRSQETGHLQLHTVQMRDFAEGRYQHVDDAPYGGGAGMVARADVVTRAIRSTKAIHKNSHTIFLSPAGRRVRQSDLRRLADREHSLILLCGRYEGIDRRAIEKEVDEELSLGDFVLMGGEVAALALIEGILRLRPGVLGNTNSLAEESFSEDLLLEAPHYTRPENFEGSLVPDVLLSGNHERIAAWRRAQSIELTRTRLAEEMLSLRDRIAKLDAL